jgi:Tfp pilus assembly PilM family ATPase
MTTKESIIGLSFSDRNVQAVEIEHDGSSHTLLAVDDWENTLPANVGENGRRVDQFMEYLSAFIRVNHIKTRQVSVALDTASLFINTIPMEDDISQTEINDHINWELGQYFPDTRAKDFITDTHVLTYNKTQHWNDVLTVSVRRHDAYLVQDALSRLGLNLHIVDVDHLSADTALRKNYPDSVRRYIALVGVKENRLDISLIKFGDIESYRYLVVDSNKEIIEQIGTLSKETKGIHSITAYGPYLDKDLLVQIRRGSSLLVEALNPLRHVKVSDSLRLTDRLSVPTYRFASAVGVALRQD